MNVTQFRRTLREFARQARNGNITSDAYDSRQLADLADQLESRMQLNEAVIKSNTTISSAPSGACPCCGK